ncbi:serine/threonine-protein kinase [Streptomyces sp. NPDC055749]
MSTQPPGAKPVRTALSAHDPYEIGGYRLHARLGAGGMGVVYLAYTLGGRPIALKAVREDFATDPGFRQRFADEVASARRIHGLFTAQVVDSGVDDPVPWLATAYVPGPSLAQVVQRHGPLPSRTVLLLVAGIAEALQAIHRAGVVHRDLKPANVLIAEDGPRVIDFGIARAADATGLTGTGLRIGTAAYMAPEQAMGLPVTPAADVFALGALAAYVAGGALPFGTGPEPTTLYRVVHEPPDLSRVPHELHELLWGCLSKQPEARPAPGDIIAAVRAHPLVASSLEFTHGWLPAGVRREIGDGGEQPAPVPSHAAPTHAGPTPTHAQSTLLADVVSPRLARADGVVQDGPADPPPRPRRRRRRRGVLAGAAVAVALVSAGSALYVTGLPGKPGGGVPGAERRPGSSASSVETPSAPAAQTPSASASSAPPPAGHTPGYADAELTAPDPSYEFDLRAGKVVPAETASWYLAWSGDTFVPPEDSDAFVAAGYVLSPADCERGIETEPVTELLFDDLVDERPFCVRSPDQKEIVIVRLVEAEAEDGPVTVVLSHYTRGD